MGRLPGSGSNAKEPSRRSCSAAKPSIVKEPSCPTASRPETAKADARTRTGDPFITRAGQLKVGEVGNRYLPIKRAISSCLLIAKERVWGFEASISLPSHLRTMNPEDWPRQLAE